MKKLRAYLSAAHFGPTMLITAIAFIFTWNLWWEGPAYVVAFTVFLGQLGGSVYMLGVGCGIAYNFYFKFSPLSPLPYAIALAALPASMFYGASRTPLTWMVITGSLLGVSFHFLNVLKDLSQDQESKIGGLPQRLGKGKSLVVVAVLLGLSVAITINALI